MGVPAEDAHHFASIHVNAAGQPSNLVRKGYLDRVERVAGVLQGLGGGHVDVSDLLVEEVEQALAGRPGARVRGSEDHERRGEEVSSSGLNAGSTTERPVPGGTVDRMTTEWKPEGGGATSAIASRRSPRARAM